MDALTKVGNQLPLEYRRLKQSGNTEDFPRQKLLNGVRLKYGYLAEVIFDPGGVVNKTRLIAAAHRRVPIPTTHRVSGTLGVGRI